MKKNVGLLIALISGLTITGVSFIDKLIWQKIFVFCGIAASTFVSFLASLGIVKGSKQKGKVFTITIIALCVVIVFVYNKLVQAANWFSSQALGWRILIIALASFIFVGLLYLLIMKLSEDEDEN